MWLSIAHRQPGKSNVPKPSKTNSGQLRSHKLVFWKYKQWENSVNQNVVRFAYAERPVNFSDHTRIDSAGRQAFVTNRIRTIVGSLPPSDHWWLSSLHWSSSTVVVTGPTKHRALPNVTARKCPLPRVIAGNYRAWVESIEATCPGQFSMELQKGGQLYNF